MAVLLFLLIIIGTVVFAMLFLRKKRRRRHNSYIIICEEMGNLLATASEESHTYSEISCDQSTNTDEQYDDILSATASEESHVYSEIGYDQVTADIEELYDEMPIVSTREDTLPISENIACDEQAPSQTMADIFWQSVVRNAQSSEVKLFDASRQVHSMYEHLVSCEQVPDPSPFRLHIADADVTREAAEISTTYERVNYSRTIEEMCSCVCSGDLKIENTGSYFSAHTSDLVTESVNCEDSQTPNTQCDRKAGVDIEQPYEQIQYREGTVRMLKMLASNPSEYECVQPYELVASYERVKYREEVIKLARDLGLEKDPNTYKFVI